MLRGHSNQRRGRRPAPPTGDAQLDDRRERNREASRKYDAKKRAERAQQRALAASTSIAEQSARPTDPAVGLRTNGFPLAADDAGEHEQRLASPANDQFMDRFVRDMNAVLTADQLRLQQDQWARMYPPNDDDNAAAADGAPSDEYGPYSDDDFPGGQGSTPESSNRRERRSRGHFINPYQESQEDDQVGHEGDDTVELATPVGRGERENGPAGVIEVGAQTDIGSDSGSEYVDDPDAMDLSSDTDGGAPAEESAEDQLVRG